MCLALHWATETDVDVDADANECAGVDDDAILVSRMDHSWEVMSKVVKCLAVHQCSGASNLQNLNYLVPTMVVRR